MKIKCMLTDSKEYKQFNCFEDMIYTIKISKNYSCWYYDLCDLIDFYKSTDVEIVLEVADSDLVLARKLYGNHKYNERVLREYETEIMVHSTTQNYVDSILTEKKLKSWNLLKAEKEDWEEKPIGALLGDIEDFSNYVMLSSISQNNEIVTASKANGVINTDINQFYVAGARFYLDARQLAADGLLLRDGTHIKVKNYINLDKYMIWYSTPKILGINGRTTPNEFFELSNKRFRRELIYSKKFLDDCKKIFKRNQLEYEFNQEKITEKYFDEFSVIEGYVDFSFELGHLLDTFIKIPTKPALQFALLRIHEQSIKVYHESTLLLENGSASGAMARWRTLFELSVVANILIKYPKLAIKYIDYIRVSDYKYANKIVRYKGKLNLNYYNMDAYDEIKSEYKKAVQEYGWNGKNPYEWAKNEDIKNPNLFELSKNIGQEQMYAYVDEAHLYNHPSPRYLVNDRGAKSPDEEDINKYLFSPFDLDIPIQLIIISLYQVNCACIKGYYSLESADKSILDSYLDYNKMFPEKIMELITNKFRKKD